MPTVKDALRDADPLRHEPRRLDDERDRIRQAVLGAGPDGAAASPRRFRARSIVLGPIVVLLILIALVASRIWSRADATLQAAVRFEVRLAETQPAPDLRAARIAGSNRTIYLYPDVIVTNDDISESHVTLGNTPSEFWVAVTFNAAGAEKMRRATAGHIGAPVAILIDGDVLMAPTLRSPIADSAVITGDFTKREAERIANGMSLR
jgi:preprotein translocase subunit SecD